MQFSEQMSLSDDEEQLVAELSCEFFEATRMGLAPDVESYLQKLPKLEQREMFIVATNLSVFLAHALRENQNTPASKS